MATLLDSPVTFFTKATPEQFAFVLGKYREIFKVHAQETRGAKKNGPAELIKLDNWYQDTLPQLIKGRKEQQLLYDEIVQITKWKLLRGKFRPSILDLVRTNTETAIKNVTKKAFKKMPNINAAMTALTQLKGIAPATASAILVAHSPCHACYMSDENMSSTPGIEASDLSISEYLNYVDQTNICVERLKALDQTTGWTPHKVELAVWTYYQAKQYNSNLLDSMPMANGKNVVNEQSDDVKLDEESHEENDRLNEDEGVNSNSDRSEEDENSNHSIGSSNSNQSNQSNQSIEQKESEEMNVDSQPNKTNGHLNNVDETSNLTSSHSSENEDKSNDSLLNNSKDETLNVENESSDLNNKETVTSTEAEAEAKVESSEKEQQTNNNETNNQMEVVTTSEPTAVNMEVNVEEEQQAVKVEELNNHVNDNNNQIHTTTENNHKLENKLEELKEKSINNLDLNNHLSNGINKIFNGQLNNKESLISSSEDNSNNLSEENSNSNLSYPDHNNLDLHSTDNALDDQPALKRIRVE